MITAILPINSEIPNYLSHALSKGTQTAQICTFCGARSYSKY